ncbi:WD-repeat protein, partial [Reticulomyxa filosa]
AKYFVIWKKLTKKNKRTSARISADGQRIVVWQDEFGQLVDLVRDSKVTLDADVRGAMFARKQNLVVSWTNDDVQIWDVQGQSIQFLGLFDVTDVHFYGTNKSLFIRSGSDIQLVDLKYGHVNTILQSAICPTKVYPSQDLTKVMSLTSNGSIEIWKARSIERIRKWTGDPDIQSIHFSPDGRNIAYCTLSKDIKLLDVNSGNEETLIGHKKSVKHVQFSCDGKILVSCSYDKTIRLWNVKTKQLIQVVRGHSDVVTEAYISSDNSTIISLSNDSTIRLWR